MYGPLPEIVIQNSGDTFQHKEKLGNETCKLLAIVRLRDQVVTWVPGGEFPPPTSIDGQVVVGFQAKPNTWIAEGKDFLKAYHDLHGKIVG